jgi:hypothetical protein
MRLTLIIIGLLFATGCADTAHEQNPMRSQIGKNCNVYFRRDALGMAADLPASVTTGNLNGAEVTQAGELMDVGDDWIVIGFEGRFFHIPQASIQMVEFGKYASTRADLSEARPEPPITKAPDGHEHH